ncbi:MAG: polysaccharide deacetylase family protein [Gemmatimonadales bacterium]|jgi:peptidoglycan/xylan/chitin deacetylase (PgdA/CDA1 family)
MRTLRRRARKALLRAARLRFVTHPPAGVILGYHRVAADPSDPYENCVSPTAFRSQLAVLARVARPVSLSALLDEPHGGPGRVALTFDDGYADFALAALPILREFDVPATLFVVSGAIGRDEYWWDRLADLRGDIAGTPAFQALHDELSALDPERREARLREMTHRNGDSPAAPPVAGQDARRPMTTSELRAVAREPLVEIGAHSRTHPRLARLGERRLIGEIEGSGTDLAELLGRPIPHFAYPHGSHSRRVRECVEAAGFAAACASTEDVVRAGELPLALPRFWVPDIAGPEFETWLLERLPAGRRKSAT